MTTNWRLLVVICIFPLLVACGRGSDDQVRDFFHDIARGAQADAAARFSPDLHEKFSDATLHDALVRWSNDMAAHGGLKDMSVSGSVITYNELALYDVTLFYADGKTKKLKTTLVHTKGNWYINSAL
jgi:hypothetical protein